MCPSGQLCFLSSSQTAALPPLPLPTTFFFPPHPIPPLPTPTPRHLFPPSPPLPTPPTLPGRRCTWTLWGRTWTTLDRASSWQQREEKEGEGEGRLHWRETKVYTEVQLSLSHYCTPRVYCIRYMCVVVITHFRGLQVKYNTRPRQSQGRLHFARSYN